MSYAGFLDAIREDPRSDVPRLICADWFEDNHQSDRAEFIRIQLEISAGVGDRARRFDLYRRMMQILDRHRANWLGVLAEHGRVPIFDRGFIEQVALQPSAFVAHGEAIFRDHPIYQLHILTDEPWPEEFGDCPALAYVTTLDLSNNNLPPREMANLGASPYLEKLASLDLRHCGLNGSGLKQFLSCRVFPSLTRLNLRENSLSTAGIQALAETPNLPALADLNLSQANLNDRSAAALAKAKHLRKLQSLRLSYNRLTEEGVRLILSSPTLPALTFLEVYGAEIDSEAKTRLRAQFRERIVC